MRGGGPNIKDYSMWGSINWGPPNLGNDHIIVFNIPMITIFDCD